MVNAFFEIKGFKLENLQVLDTEKEGAIIFRNVAKHLRK
jgi:hypothetical protein